MAGYKDSVSINVCIGPELFKLLSDFCEITGQSKTVAVERAIAQLCEDDEQFTDQGSEALY